jgi:hypothetical protein
MRVLVVGGLGYLGSVISDLLTAGGQEVYILDNAIWNNGDVLKEIRCNNIIKFEDVIRDSWDYVILAHNIDVDSFYELVDNNYLQEQKQFIKNLKKKSPCILNCSTWELDYNIVSKKNDYFKEIETIVCESAGKNIRVPNLYGPSPRMRWDTTVNEIYYSALVQKSIVLEDDWLSKMPLCSVYDFALYIRNSIINNSFYEIMQNDVYAFKLNTIEIAAIIKHLLKDEDIEIRTIRYTACIEPIQINLPLQKCLSVIESMHSIKLNMANNMLPDYMNEKYNNAAVIGSALASRNLLRIIMGIK